MNTPPENYPESPKHLWQQFYQFTQIPRASGKEEQIRNYILSMASKHQLKSQVDAVGNVIIYVPGRGSNKNNDTVIIQNHMDMVTDKTPGHEHDFDTDPLQIYVDNGWVSALNTTLGADNGIGCAAALALLEEPELDHPPLELLFTVDEETGLNGALGLDACVLSGKKLINLDTEEWGSAYIGCAGGVEYNFSGQYELDETVQANTTLKIGALKGGHSGIDIHRGRANAIKLLGQLLQMGKNFNIRVSSFDGGKAHNIIPRDAQVSFYLPPESFDAFEIALKDIQTKWQLWLNPEDLKYSLELEPSGSGPCLTANDSNALINLMSLFPHGARKYNWDTSEPLVSMSNNLAIFRLHEGELFIQTSLRFFDRSELSELESEMVSLGDTFGLTTQSGGDYPSWKPDLNNPMVEQLKKVYQNNFKGELEIKAIHAGLECGILTEKLGKDVKAISLGPTIKGAHSPTESLDIETTRQFWQLLINFLKVL